MLIALKVKPKNGLLQKFIDDMDWSQSDFARAIGVSTSLVGDWFNLKNFPRDNELMKKVCELVGEQSHIIFPEFLRSREFIQNWVRQKHSKGWSIYREVDLEYLPFNQVPQLSYEQDFDSFQMTEKINEYLSCLTPKEREVIEKRFGLCGEHEQTLEEVGEQLGLCKDRISQIEVKAIRKMRHPDNSYKFRDLYPH